MSQLRTFPLALFLIALALGDGCGTAANPAKDPEKIKARALKKQLEAFHDRKNPQAIDFAWPHLDSPDESIRGAARGAIEAQPFDWWKERALAERDTWATIEALLALVHACPREQGRALAPHVYEGITTLRIEQMNAEQMLASARLTRSALSRFQPTTEDAHRQMLDLWTQFFPCKRFSNEENHFVNLQLYCVLGQLDAPDIVEKTMALLRTPKEPYEQLNYLSFLGAGIRPRRPGETAVHALTSWTPELRAEFFAWIDRTEAERPGDKGFKKMMEPLRQRALKLFATPEKEPAPARER